ncbi:conserved hypothetical protein [Vibrio crassostreae]|nr:conserved hypothetical protein [Vibrio crassostreae]
MRPVEIAMAVGENMPSIGFLSKTKRMEAFSLACHMIEELCQDENGEIDIENAFESAAILLKINKRFEKAFIMVLLNFERLPVGSLGHLAYGIVHSAKYQK